MTLMSLRCKLDSSASKDVIYYKVRTPKAFVLGVLISIALNIPDT